jgi:Elongation factor Tu domain 2
MATRTKSKGKTKRKKKAVTKTAPRKKTAAAKKTKTIRKKTAKKPPHRVLSKKPTAKAAVKPQPVTAPAKPEVARPAAQPALPEERIGVVTHYFGRLSVATLRLETGTLRVGDIIRIRGHTTDFSQKVESVEVNHAAVTEVAPNDDFGLKVVEHVREHDVVFKVRS